MYIKKCIIKDLKKSGEAEITNAQLLESLTSISEAHTNFAKIKLPEGIAWIVLDWKLHIEKRPSPGVEYTMRTWVPSWNKFFGVRCYDILDADGVKCAEASSRWTIVDLNTRKLVTLTPDIMDLYGIDKGISEIENEAFIKNIAKSAALIKSSDAEITDDMIDKNNHVHNTVYSDLAESILPEGSSTDFADISYRKEIHKNEEVILELCSYEENNLVLIKTKGNQDANAILLYKNNAENKNSSSSCNPSNKKEYIWGTEDWIYQDDDILVKIIDAKKPLSIQVHPNDEYAKIHENGSHGKNEMWYVLDAQSEAFVYCGVREPLSKEQLKASALDGTLENYLVKHFVKAGDVINIPAGTIHAIGGGLRLLEIQQNSNITYRLYDYKRLDANGKPRQLHLDKALDVANLNTSENLLKLPLETPYFTVYETDKEIVAKWKTSDGKFRDFRFQKNSKI